MTKIDTILFDFDGTIMNTNKVIINSWQHTFKIIEGKEGSEEEILKTFGEPLEITMARFFPEMPVQEAVRIYRSYHYDNFESMIELFSGMRELLTELKDRDFKTGIVTSRLRNTTEQGLEKFDIKDYFDIIVAYDDTAEKKPDPEPINIALEKLGSKPETSLMLGDTRFDMGCARNAGVVPVLADWAAAKGYGEVSGMIQPDYILETPDNLFAIIDDIEW